MVHPACMHEELASSFTTPFAYAHMVAQKIVLSSLVSEQEIVVTIPYVVGRCDFFQRSRSNQLLSSRRSY